MSKNNNTDELIAIAAEGMEVFRVEMEMIDSLSHKIGHKTTRIIRIVLGLLSVISIYLIILTFTMGRDLTLMIDSLDAMYLEFGSMSSAMRDITANVQNMGTSIQGMPTIAQNMQHLNADVGDMLVSVEIMNQDMAGMDSNMSVVGTSTTEMSHRFNNVQRSVNMMQYDVNQMLKPLDIMPR
ncbi:MAG: hypothetical protein COB46_06710 [Rhodospirillaceae bacterium]|nr:MAG: hypothetical protein COB46_06710 [Rhodospirillaceae bacterium]